MVLDTGEAGSLSFIQPDSTIFRAEPFLSCPSRRPARGANNKLAVLKRTAYEIVNADNLSVRVLCVRRWHHDWAESGGSSHRIAGTDKRDSPHET